MRDAHASERDAIVGILSLQLSRNNRILASPVDELVTNHDCTVMGRMVRSVHVEPSMLVRT